MRHLMLTTMIATAACSGSHADDRNAAPAAKPTQARAVLADASPSALGRDIDDADKRGLWVDVKRRWEGQTVQWTVYRNRALCRSAAACNVSAFPVGAGQPAKYGWLPKLEIAADQFAVMQARCGTRETCEVRIEGRLAALELSPEMPTNVRLADVTVKI